jgi:hypothetical protein
VPLTNLTTYLKGGCLELDWSLEQDAFEKLKQFLIEAPLLHTPDEAAPFEVVTKASDIDIDGVLLQEGHHVAFESRKLKLC